MHGDSLKNNVLLDGAEIAEQQTQSHWALIDEAKLQLQKVSSRLVVLITPRAFTNAFLGSELKGSCQESYDVCDFQRTKKPATA